MRQDMAQVVSGQSVLIRSGNIEAIGPSGSIQAPSGFRVVDGQGQYLMPGLIDAHIHLSDEVELAAYLAHGGTGVRNMSGYPFHLTIPERYQDNELFGPDFITTGPILNSHGPNENLIQQIVTTAEEAREAVRQQYRQGYRALKIYSNLTREAYTAILEEAANLGLPITGHSPEGVREVGIPWEKPFEIPWEGAVGKGFTTLEHLETIVWHGLRDDLDEQKMAQLADELVASGDVVTPTLIAHRRLVLIAQTKGEYLNRPGSETINPFVRLIESGSENYWKGADVSDYEAPHAAYFITAAGILHRAGVPLLVGTDAGSFGIIPGASMTREHELFIEAGIPAYNALKSATILPAKILGFEKAGMISPGFKANLVLLQGNPLDNISVVEHSQGVMIGGRWLDEKQIQALQKAARDTSMLRSAGRAVQMLLAK
ncbi:amidohydrolase family protein [Aliiglaciecola sp. CAU 1673]|uniref:amidohydrolase family protein n=1 Tax=Aliiglaciecola sp. CAU 1673 TaxID=3032595 RepID=UPI0023DBCB50|nr:amidohydrolase family protein [Aliiglaciecola sp. CAU 1673]MDF2179853.1 amidohydrolase family protein [Aliiglaciecola sp. CAU 1673]